ncbi:unnamed protein product [Ectocarpus sp. 4 AP-2014]
MSELFGVDAVPGPSPPGYGNEGASTSVLQLRQEDGYEQVRRVRNVIEHLRRGSAAHKPLVVVVANSGVPEEVRGVLHEGESTGNTLVKKKQRAWEGTREACSALCVCEKPLWQLPLLCRDMGGGSHVRNFSFFDESDYAKPRQIVSDSVPLVQHGVHTLCKASGKRPCPTKTM